MRNELKSRILSYSFSINFLHLFCFDNDHIIRLDTKDFFSIDISISILSPHNNKNDENVKGIAFLCISYAGQWSLLIN